MKKPATCYPFQLSRLLPRQATSKVLASNTKVCYLGVSQAIPIHSAASQVAWDSKRCSPGVARRLCRGKCPENRTFGFILSEISVAHIYITPVGQLAGKSGLSTSKSKFLNVIEQPDKHETVHKAIFRSQYCPREVICVTRITCGRVR